MSLRRRIERVEEWADEWQAMELAKQLAPELQRPVEELAAQALQDLRDLQAMMFFAGANSTMVGHYLTTSGRDSADDLRMIRDCGLEPDTEGCGS